MKHEASSELAIAPKAFPESMFLSKMDEIENRIARRAYELFASSGFTDGHDLEDWLLAESELFGRMPVEVTQTGKEVMVKVGVPGFAEKDIEIRTEPRRLLISAIREEKSENKKKGEMVYSESSDQVFRAIDLPAEVDPAKIKTTLGKGELEITLPTIGFHTSWNWAQSFLYGVADSGRMVEHHLFATHPVGKPILSGGATGPEGSIFVVAILALISLIIVLTLPGAHYGDTLDRSSYLHLSSVCNSFPLERRF